MEEDEEGKGESRREKNAEGGREGGSAQPGSDYITATEDFKTGGGNPK